MVWRLLDAENGLPNIGLELNYKPAGGFGRERNLAGRPDAIRPL